MTSTRRRFATPRDIARVLFRQWRKLALFSIGILLLTIVAIALYPRSYLSEAKLLLRVGRETIGLDPTATTGDTILLQKTQEDEVNSAVNILNSRKVVERVVERIGAKRIMESPEPVDATAANGTFAKTVSDVVGTIGRFLEKLRLMDPGSETDQAIRRFEKRMAVHKPKQSMVITVGYSASNPQLAHDVVDAITQVFLEEHSRLSRTEGSLKFFSDQVERLYKDLLDAQAKLRDRKNAYQLTTSANRRSILESAKEAMRQKIYQLAVQESELRSRYTDAYPPLRELQRQREQAQRLLTEMPDEPTTADAVSVGSAVAAQHSAGDEQTKLKSELQTLNDQEYELAQLQREVTLLEGKYAMHVQKLEQARVNDALGRGGISNVKVAQPATLSEKPVAPKKLVILGLGLILALFGGVGLAFMSESFDQTLRTNDQVEMELGLPVLASLPYRKRRKPRAVLPAGRSITADANGATTSLPDVGQLGGYLGLASALRPTGENGHRNVRAIGIVACDASTTHSRVAADLAIQAASWGVEPVLLIDADTRRRRVSKRFLLNGAPGWRDVIAGSAAADSCVQWTHSGSLAVMGPGQLNGQASMGTSTATGLEKLGEIKTGYGLVVVDLPSAREVGRPPVLANLVDEAVLVVEAERTRVQAAQRARDMLVRAGVPITGVVVTNRREHIPGWLYRRL